jgi:hypothetical protein
MPCSRSSLIVSTISPACWTGPERGAERGLSAGAIWARPYGAPCAFYGCTQVRVARRGAVVHVRAGRLASQASSVRQAQANRDGDRRGSDRHDTLPSTRKVRADIEWASGMQGCPSAYSGVSFCGRMVDGKLAVGSVLLQGLPSGVRCRAGSGVRFGVGGCGVVGGGGRASLGV